MFEDPFLPMAPATQAPAARMPARQLHPVVMENDDIMPRSGLGLLLDTNNYDDLVETLTTELRPPNLLAQQAIRLLAQEMTKLAFMQRVELSLMDSTQQVAPGLMHQLEEVHSRYCGGKSVVECEHELKVLQDLRSAISKGLNPSVPDLDLDWLADRLWWRITLHEKSCKSLSEDLSEMLKEVATVPEEEKERFLHERHRTEEELAEDQAEDARSGRAAHGVDTADDLAAALRGKAPIAKDKTGVWLEMLGTYIGNVQSNRRHAIEFSKRLAGHRSEAAQGALYKIDQLSRVQQHSAGIRKSIDQCLRQLQMFGVNLKAARACNPQCIMDGVSE